MKGRRPSAFERRPLAVTRPLLFAIAVAIVLAPTLASAQSAPGSQDEVPSVWRALQQFVGSWEGAIDGKWGTGTGLRQYESVVQSKYLQVRQSSVRPPQPATPEGDEHEEMGVFSYDRHREVVVYREFLGEGYVTRYVCTAEGDSIVCRSEDIENGPNLQTRLVLGLIDSHHFVEVYEIGRRGEKLERWFTNHWTRVPGLRQ